MITPVHINGYIAPFKPVSNATPFTYRDAETNMEILRRMREFVNIYVIDFVNKNFTELGDAFETEVNSLIDTINLALVAQTEANNEAIQEMVDSLNTAVTNLNTAIAAGDEQTANDAADALAAYAVTVAYAFEAVAESLDADVAAKIALPTSLTRIALDVLIGNSVTTDADVAGFVNDTDSDTRTALDALYTGGSGGGLDDAGVAALVESPTSGTRTALDGLYSGGGGGLDDEGVAALVNAPTSDTRVALDALYSGGTGGLDDAGVAALMYDNESDTSSALYGFVSGPKGDEAVSELITNESGYTRLALNNLFGSGIITYPFWEDLDERVADGIVFKVTSIPNCLWVDTPNGLRAIGVPHFNTTAALTDFVSAPYNGMLATVGNAYTQVRYSEDFEKWIPWNSQWLGILPGHTGITALSDEKIYCRFVNGDMEIKADIVFGSTTATGGTINLPIPFGYKMATEAGIRPHYVGTGFVANSTPLSKSLNIEVYASAALALQTLYYRLTFDGLSSATLPSEYVTTGTVIRYNTRIKINNSTADFTV